MITTTLLSAIKQHQVRAAPPTDRFSHVCATSCLSGTAVQTTAFLRAGSSGRAAQEGQLYISGMFELETDIMR